MPAVVKNKLFLYADNSAILVSERDKSLSEDLNLVRSWLIENKLSLHLGKTESIIFGSEQKLKSNGKINLVCAGNHINSTSNVKYLGAVLDQSLLGDFMASSL